MRPKMIWVVMGLGLFFNILVLAPFSIGRAYYAGCPAYWIDQWQEDGTIVIDRSKAVERGILAPQQEITSRETAHQLAEVMMRAEDHQRGLAFMAGVVLNLVLLGWMGLIASANKKTAADASSKP